MAAWPDTDELAQVLNVDNVGDWQTTLDRVMAAAIRQVKSDRGLWDEDVDEPDENLAQAALRMAELFAQRPEAVVLAGSRGAQSAINDPAYNRLMFGHRRRFGVG